MHYKAKLFNERSDEKIEIPFETSVRIFYKYPKKILTFLLDFSDEDDFRDYAYIIDTPQYFYCCELVTEEVLSSYFYSEHVVDHIYYVVTKTARREFK